MKVINIIFLSLLLSCNAQQEDAEKQGAQQPDAKTPSPINCYRYATEADTVILKVVHIGTSITGTLVYNLKEKDSNKGTIQGAMRGNVLVADYTFMSEGIQSIRQVAFKLEGNTFIEGYGDSFNENEKMKFKNLDSLTFSSTIKLSEMACQ
jgi:hypothetical protein